MLISVPMYKKFFKAETYKEAYKKSSVWIAQNIMSNETLPEDITWRIAKQKENGIVEMTVYVSLNITEERGKFCKICKDYHKSFFINEDFNCSRCNMVTYERKIKDKVLIKKGYAKEKLKQSLNLKE